MGRVWRIGGPVGRRMVKTIEEAMDELRRDVARWNVEIAQLQEQGQHELVTKMKRWIEEAERVLTRGDEAAS